MLRGTKRSDPLWFTRAARACINVLIIGKILSIVGNENLNGGEGGYLNREYARNDSKGGRTRKERSAGDSKNVAARHRRFTDRKKR